MGEPKGTDNVDLGADWYLVKEAECVDSLDALEDLFDESTDSNISNLIDDDDVQQGDSLALYHTQITEECNKAILDLKRKYITSPDRSVADLSPRLEAVRISPHRQSKRRLFDDSGIGEDEAENHVTEIQVEETACHSQKDGARHNLNLLNASNRKAVMLAKFKECFGVSYNELTRQFKSDKTCCENWVMFLYQVAEEVLESSKVVLQQYCEYLQVIMESSFNALYLVSFKTAKNRDTIIKLLISLLNISELQVLTDPPKVRSVPAALFFYQKTMSNVSFVYGSTPDWVAKHTLVNHSLASAAETFELSTMIQWAYDNEYTEEDTIAYEYALLADTDPNAAAFLKSNQQCKYVRDCAHMAKLYRRHEMKRMSVAQWIQKCCDQCEGLGDWKVIAAFLRFQEVNVVTFLTHIRTWLKCIPKKNCLLIHGQPDTGKSYFCFSLMHFLKGKVVSYMNRGSQFWLQPLQDTKFGFIDDATYACWQYIDMNMRAGLDGNYVSVDAKHKAPSQIKLPPLLITSNIDIHNEPTLMYLHSRITSICFPNKLPFNADGTPVFNITDQTWKSFFAKLATQLDLIFEEEGDESGRSDRPFRCTAGGTAESI